MLDARTILVTRVARLMALAVCGAIAITTALAFAPTLFGRQVLIVTSRSMEPWAEVGGVVLTRSVPVSSIEVGDVITFRSDGAPATTHRVVEIVEREGETSTFVTKGDASEDADPQPVTISGNVAVAEQAFPFVGRLLVAVRAPFAALAFILVGVAIAFLERSLGAMQRRFRPAPA